MELSWEQASDEALVQESLLGVAVSPDGIMGAVASDDGVLRVYDLQHNQVTYSV